MKCIIMSPANVDTQDTDGIEIDNAILAAGKKVEALLELLPGTSEIHSSGTLVMLTLAFDVSRSVQRQRNCLSPQS